jgi:DNA-binding MurR/RpiR family transcriptional regulator
MTRTNNPLNERITKNYSKFTKSNRSLADYLQAHPDKVLILSTNEIAEACSVSKTTVSRFIRSLGYEDHAELRNELLVAREQGEPLLMAEFEGSGLQEEMRSLEQLWTQLNEMDLQPLINKIAKAKRIKIIGYRNSYPLAMHFRQQLMQCRAGVDLLPLPGQTIGEDLASIDADDFIIIIGIRRRVHNFSDVIELLSNHNCLLISDQSGQKYAQKVSHFLVCYMSNHASLDSYAVPMSLISYLSNQTYQFLNSEAVKVSRKISINYSQLNELE